ncbi:right-handed parallel beta-helix repeat-containing protein, partial [Thermosynechococcus sp.]|uniref:right-handed parallel beta-helix repeat-containing protein n=1 Tax=Thermosynechococcus sp. TaxID=2814275 RepID=UPI00391CD5CE
MVFTVAAFGSADFHSISEALAAVPAHSTLAIKPGHYAESLEINKPIEIVGEGELGEVVIFSPDASCLVMAAPVARIVNVLFDYKGAGTAIKVPQGRLILENCRIELLPNANQGIGIEIAGSTTSPVVQDCHIQGGRRGIVIREGAKANIEECTVTES